MLVGLTLRGGMTIYYSDIFLNELFVDENFKNLHMEKDIYCEFIELGKENN